MFLQLEKVKDLPEILLKRNFLCFVETENGLKVYIDDRYDLHDRLNEIEKQLRSLLEDDLKDLPFHFTGSLHGPSWDWVPVYSLALKQGGPNSYDLFLKPLPKGELRKVDEPEFRSFYKGNIELGEIEQKGIRPAFGSPGGKRYLAKTIVSYIPKHKIYVEPFVGGGAVFFAKEPSEVEVINDLDPEIAFAYKAIQTLSSNELDQLKKFKWIGDPRLFKKLKNSKPKNKLERLYRFLYLTRFGYGCDRRDVFDSTQENQEFKILSRINRIKSRLKNVKIKNQDYTKILEEFDSKDTFFYLDPPYPKLSHQALKISLPELREALTKLKGKFILSIDKESGRQFPGFEKKNVKVSQQMNVGGMKQQFRTELLISNFPLKKQNIYLTKDREASAEAEESLKEDKIKMFRFFHNLKPTRAVSGNEPQSVEAVLRRVGDYEWFVEVKKDGMTCLAFKEGQKVEIWSEDGTERTKELPKVADAIRQLDVSSCILGMEVELWEGGHHFPREAIAGKIHRRGEPETEGIVATVFECMYLNGKDLHKEDEEVRRYLNGKDLHKEDEEVRRHALDSIKFPQSTEGVPDTKLALNKLPTHRGRGREEIEKLMKRVINAPGSEGAVLKRVDAKYYLDGNSRMEWFKYHKTSRVFGIVYGIQETKKEGIFNYLYALDFGKYKVKQSQQVKVGEKNYIKVGKTFSTDTVVKKGQIIEIEIETLNFTVDERDVSIQIGCWCPRFLRIASERKTPDSVDEVVKRAKANGVLSEKKIDKDGETHYLEKRNLEDNLTEVCKIFAPPPEDKTYKYAVSAHFIGRSAHWDDRVEYNDKLQGFTLAVLMPGALKEPVETMVQARKAIKNPDLWKINPKTGEFRKRRVRGGVVRRTSIWAALKAPEPCFAADTLVWTDAGLRKIQDIREGDVVLDADGNWTKVTKCFKTPAAGREVKEVKANECLPLRVTSDHPFLTAKLTSNGKADLQWKKVAEIDLKNDYLVMPKVKFKDPLKYVFYQKFDQNGLRGHPVFLELDWSFGYVLGLICGDGNLDEGGVVLSLGEEKKEVFPKLDSFFDRYGITHSWRKADHGDYYQYEVSDSQFAKLIKLIVLNAKQNGTHSRYKEVSPAFLERTNEDFVRGFVQGLLDSDGSKRAGTLGSHSLGLISSMLFANLLLGKVLNFSVRDYESDLSYLSTHKQQRKRYRGYRTSKVTRYKKFEMDVGDKFALKIRYIKGVPRQYKYVYNLETESNTYCVVNAAVHNCAWLGYEGVITAGPGRSRYHVGVLVTVDKGVAEYGSILPYFVEFFRHGKVFNGRYFYRMLPTKRAREVEKLEGRALLEYLVYNENEINSELHEIFKQELGPAEEQPARGGYFWLLIKPDDQTPYVLQKDTVRKGWVPPEGISALPKEIRKKVPSDLQYWKKKSLSERRKLRDELVKYFEEEKVTKSTAKFVLQYQTFRGPIHVRFGPTTELWRFWIKKDNTISHYVFESDPIKKIAAGLRESYASENEMNLGVGSEEPVKVDPGTRLNPTKNTPSFIEVVASGSLTFLEDSREFKKFRIRSGPMKGLWILFKERPDINIWTLSKTEEGPGLNKNFYVPIVKVAPEKHLVYGEVLVPETEDAQGDVISADVIEDAAHDFLVNSRRIDVQHAFLSSRCFPVESFIAPTSFHLGDHLVKKGTWVLVTKIFDEEIWKKVKNGELRGYSIRGIAEEVPLD